MGQHPLSVQHTWAFGVPPPQTPKPRLSFLKKDCAASTGSRGLVGKRELLSLRDSMFQRGCRTLQCLPKGTKNHHFTTRVIVEASSHVPLYSSVESTQRVYVAKLFFVSARTNKRHHHHHEELPRHSDQVGQEMEPQEYLVMIHPPDPPGPTVCLADADAALAAHPPYPPGPTEIAAPIPIHLAAAAAGAPTQS